MLTTLTKLREKACRLPADVSGMLRKDPDSPPASGCQPAHTPKDSANWPARETAGRQNYLPPAPTRLPRARGDVRLGRSWSHIGERERSNPALIASYTSIDGMFSPHRTRLSRVPSAGKVHELSPLPKLAATMGWELTTLRSVTENFKIT